MINKIIQWFKNKLTNQIKQMHIITYYNKSGEPITQRVVSCNSEDNLAAIASSGLMYIEGAASFTVEELD